MLTNGDTLSNMLDNIENGKVNTGILQRIVDFLKGIFYKMNIAKNFTDNETKIIENALRSYEKALANAVKVDNQSRSGYNNKIKYSIYDEYQTNAMIWSRSADTKPKDLKILNVNGKYFALIKATKDGFEEIKTGSYREVYEEYEQAYRNANNKIYGNTESIELNQRRDIWDMQYVGDRGYALRNGGQTESERFQNNSSGNDEYLRNSNNGKRESKTQRDSLYNDSGRRESGKRTGKQDKGVDGRSKRYREGRTTAYERRKWCRELRDEGKTRRRIIEGHECDVIPEDCYTERMRKIEHKNRQQGVIIVFSVGEVNIPNVMNYKGSPKTANGAFIDTGSEKIKIVQYDNYFYSPEQIDDHEDIHRKYHEPQVQKVKNIIINSLTSAQRKDILESVSRAYSGIADGNEAVLYEEFVARVLSGMSEYSDMFYDLTKAYWNGDEKYINSYEQNIKNKVTVEDKTLPLKNTVKYSVSTPTMEADEQSADTKPKSQMDELIDTYGEIEQGEAAVRTVHVPKKISDDKPVSRFARTMMEAKVTPKENISEFEQMILDGTMTHEVISDKSAMQRAKKTISDNGFKNALNTWRVLIEEGKVGKRDIALGMELYNQAVYLI